MSPANSKRILVTGGAGYIGAHTVHLLLERGYGVTVVDNLSRGYRHNVEGVAFEQLDIRDTDAMARVLEGHDAVIHFAAYIAVGESMKVPEVYFANNTGGSLSLMTAMVRAGVKPYYLFQGDLAAGTAHFRVPIETGIALMQELRGRMSGIALPTYAVDLPGGGGKVPVETALVRTERDLYVLRGADGREYTYPRETQPAS